ncbi:hypothetical protein CONCODRAFT_89856 [Conidiobolus coronatus NRRL 28638]|uniref:Extracellular membrane protein CFEM domain-containing protein n=1 Tax=Conidiobolus coronatus (strain ATCC 28846 / CBS 209.66 / NRRL 28638) TaxID=796925 RepID=A0A137PGT1_CONC2|nr:hypothetical protein CONCODRAFT_89856 [Conidiobolus coronatus NRRL 28638]|eukprot:KXN74141.1 hypothetical protein CONCODRAFT_89856 [Conidiobolus coronatus NRRL 28638]
MNSKIVFFTLLSALLAQDAGKISDESLKCLKEKNCGIDINCIPACFKGTEMSGDLPQKAVNCMTKNCLKEAADQNKFATCAGTCYATIAKEKKEDDKEKKEDDKDKKEENKDEKKDGDKEKKDDNKDKKDDSKEKKEEPKMAENANKGNSASALTGSAAFALVLSAISMAL